MFGGPALNRFYLFNHGLGHGIFSSFGLAWGLVFGEVQLFLNLTLAARQLLKTLFPLKFCPDFLTEFFDALGSVPALLQAECEFRHFKKNTFKAYNYWLMRFWNFHS